MGIYILHILEISPYMSDSPVVVFSEGRGVMSEHFKKLLLLYIYSSFKTERKLPCLQSPE